MPPLGALREVSSRRLTSFIPLIRSPYVLVVAGPARRVVDFPLAGCNDSCHLCSGGGPIPIRVQLFLGIRADNFLRSEEHTSELQSRGHLVCRLLLEKKK